jgi:hypothetical protein
LGKGDARSADRFGSELAHGFHEFTMCLEVHSEAD